MNHTVIALRGRQKMGKTTTLRKAWRLLRSRFPDATVGNRQGVKDKEIRGSWLEIDGGWVGFATKSEPVESDEQDTVQDDLDRLEGAGCVVIVCATHGKNLNGRTDSKSEKAVKDFADEEGWAFHPIDKSCRDTEGEQVGVNGRQAELIVRTILSLIVSTPDLACT